MKRFLLCIALVFGLSAASVALAADTAGYVTGTKAKKPVPQMTATGSKKIAALPTDITIYNSTPFYIFFSLAGSNVLTAIEPYEWGFVQHSYLYNNVRIQIKSEASAYVAPFWDDVVCSRAVIAVSAPSYGTVAVSVNSRYC